MWVAHETDLVVQAQPAAEEPPERSVIIGHNAKAMFAAPGLL